MLRFDLCVVHQDELLRSLAGTSLYVICAKVALGRGYKPSTVTAWSYLAGAGMLLPVAVILSSSCDVVAFVCPPLQDSEGGPPFRCGGLDGVATTCEPFAVPASAVLPLAYWILFNSCAAYWLLTWAARHTKASFVLAYCAMQPLTSVVISLMIIGLAGDVGGLRRPGLNTLGAVAIIAGMMLILRDGKKQHDADENEDGSAFARLGDPDSLRGKPYKQDLEELQDLAQGSRGSTQAAHHI